MNWIQWNIFTLLMNFSRWRLQLNVHYSSNYSLFVTSNKVCGGHSELFRVNLHAKRLIPYIMTSGYGKHTPSLHTHTNQTQTMQTLSSINQSFLITCTPPVLIRVSSSHAHPQGPIRPHHVIPWLFWMYQSLTCHSGIPTLPPPVYQ